MGGKFRKRSADCRRGIQAVARVGGGTGRADENAAASHSLGRRKGVFVGDVVADVDGKGVGSEPGTYQLQGAAFVPVDGRAQLDGGFGGGKPNPAGCDCGLGNVIDDGPDLRVMLGRGLAVVYGQRQGLVFNVRPGYFSQGPIEQGSEFGEVRYRGGSVGMEVLQVWAANFQAMIATVHQAGDADTLAHIVQGTPADDADGRSGFSVQGFQQVGVAGTQHGAFRMFNDFG